MHGAREAIVKRLTLQWRFLNFGFPLLLVLPLCSVLAVGQLTANLTSLSFGNIQVGSTGTQSFLLSNTSNWSISISQATVSAAPFTLSGFAAPATLSPGTSTQVTVVFSPQATGTASGSASFTFSAIKTNGNSGKRNGLQTSTLAVSLSGTGVGAGQLSPNPASLNMGGVPLGSSSTQSGTLSNTGGSSLTVSQASVTNAAFNVSGITLPQALAPGQSAAYLVTFTPQSQGSVSGNVTFSSNGSNPTLNVALSGTAVSPGTLAANPTSDNFGTVQVGTTQSVYQTITNSGGASVTISQASATGAGFGITGLGLPLTLSPGQSVTFTASFSPTTVGSTAGSITILSNATDPTLTIGLSGAGAAQGQLTITPSSEDFGTVTVGTNTSKSGSIGASGSSVTISSGSINSSEFLLNGISFPLTLAAGQSIPVTLTFAPQTSGSASATLSLVSNASNSPAALLTGTGSAPAQHSVALSWNDSGSGIAGYNIYRASVSGGPYSVINSGLNSTTSYNDGAVQAGQTYYYAVTAVDVSGIESTYSNEVPAAVPSP
jgi:Abnormal spindle-like microcephaly-assoc'd, ASPM-SPD-2-Hydin